VHILQAHLPDKQLENQANSSGYDLEKQRNLN
jgi:hypothetical protein